jgi:hypothetical protein
LPYLSKIEYRPYGKESTEVQKTQKMEKRKGKNLQKMKRSLEERHTQTHRNLYDIF